MKFALVGSVALIAFVAAGPAAAADMRVKAPVYKAAPAPRPVMAAYNWTGCYIGAQAGYTWGRTTYLDTQDLTGTSFDLNGGVAGGHVGCNYQVNSFVIGIEGDYEWTGLKGDDAAYLITLDRVEGRWQGSICGRAGFAVDRVLFYATGGWSALNVEYSVSNVFINTEVIRRTLSGWTAGAGIEYALTNNISARAEYRYARYGEEFFPTQQVAARALHDTTTNTIRGGVTYKFGDFGMAGR